MNVLPSFPRVHRHPGPETPKRFYWAIGQQVGPFRLCVARGKDLYDSVARWTLRGGFESAAFRLLAGEVQELEVMTGRPDLEAGCVATFDGPHNVECPAHVLGGHGAIGVAGANFVLHTHAIFLDARGCARGCHLVPGRCIAGSVGIVLAMFPLSDARFRVMRDVETAFDLFFPESGGRVTAPQRRLT